MQIYTLTAISTICFKAGFHLNKYLEMVYWSALSQSVQMIIAIYTFNLHIIWLTQNSTSVWSVVKDFKKERAKLAPVLNNISDLLLSIFVQ